MNYGSGIIRKERSKENPYAQIYKKGLEDARLSFKARGILAYVLAKPDNWKVRTANLVNNSKDGKAAVYSGLKELEKYGYLKRFCIRDEKNKIVAWESVVYEEPQEVSIPPERKGKTITRNKPHTENRNVEPLTDFQEVGFQEVENQALIINNVTDYSEKQQRDEPGQGDPPAADQEISVVVFSAAQEEPKPETDGQAQALEMLQGINISAETGLQLLELKRPEEIIKIVDSVTANKNIDNPAGFVRRAIEKAWTLPELQKRYDMEKEKTNALLAELAAAELTSEAPEPGLFEKLKNICRGQRLEQQLE